MYFVKRIVFAVPLLIVISALAFALVHLAPGGPFDRERAPASPEIERNLRAAYHLDEPLWKQYLRFFGLVWDKGPDGRWHHAPASFNVSFKYRDHRVSDIIAQSLPVSLLLGGLAFGFAMGVGLPLGFLTAARRGQWQDYGGSIAAMLMVCVPGFVVAPLLILSFAIKWRLLPVALWVTPWHVILPTISLGLFFAGKIGRLFREGMLSAMQSEFVTAARAKGLGENWVLVKHAVRIAILPVVSYSGPMLADLLTGSFVIETIFQIPGLGFFFINSSLNSDYTLTVDLALLYAALLIGLNLLADLAYTLLDPRVKYE
ncbi:MAG: ABC transporter permease [Verrucomicrobia bacterium]|nr:ABC transporter permease [Verrucomicrobiota bacterium]MDE3097958.1 ABC transporter permease [Verrucomicrobiota bacterium]